MTDWKWLQLFADGGDGGGEGGGEASTTGAEAQSGASLESAMEKAHIPERAKGAFKKAYERRNGAPQVQSEPKGTESTEKPTHIKYEDLIKSDEYKEEHKAYMDRTIKDRFKGQEEKARLTEEKLAKAQEALGVVATKYGLNVDSDDFLDSLNAKISEDDSYYEDYAEEHDISIEEAKKNLQLERKVKTLEAQERRRTEAEAQAKAIAELRANAEKTKAMFPEFDLEVEMQNPKFRNLCVATQGDTTAAYRAIHWNEIIPKMVASETEKAKQAIVQSIASNNQRPIESGLSKTPAAVVNARQSYKGMNAAQMLEFAKKNFTK